MWKLITATIFGIITTIAVVAVVTSAVQRKITEKVPTPYFSSTEAPVAPRGLPETANFAPVNTIGWTLRVLGTIQEVRPASLVVDVWSDNGDREKTERFDMPIAPITSIEKIYVLPTLIPGADIFAELRVSETKTVQLGTKKVSLSEVQSGESVDALLAVRSGGAWEVTRVIVTPKDFSL